jgi:YbbR domain-containing protein
VPESVEVTLSGPQRSFVLLDPNSLEVAVDASLARLGRRTYRVTDDNLVYPAALSLEAVNPGTVRISVRKPD